MSNSKIAHSQSNSLSFDSLWKIVDSNPTDFVSWTLLLQHCEHMTNINSIKKAYNKFLSNYPYCFAYWEKFAEFQHKYSTYETAFTVLEQAVQAFTISVDIWIFYITLFIKFNKNEKSISDLFERAIKYCGNDFNSTDLWSLYLNWLKSSRQDLYNITLVYDKLLEIPINKLNKHFENFKSFVEDNNPICILSKNEYNLYNTEYNISEANKSSPKSNNENVILIDSHTKPGEEVKESIDDHKAEENISKIKFIRSKILSKRKFLYEKTMKEVEERLRFENKIKRPYFHVNPLDIAQLDNWMQYLNWEIENSSHSKIIYLFERCLISCALYEYMWIRYTNYLIDKRNETFRAKQEVNQEIDIEVIRDVFRRATNIHIRNSFKLHNLWSLFEEQEGNFDEALSILEKFESENPQLIEPYLSKINLFKRKGDLRKVDSLYQNSIKKFMDNPKLLSHISMKYCRFLVKVVNDEESAIQVLNTALKHDSSNHLLYLGLIDIEYQRNNFDVEKIEQLFDDAIDCANYSVKLAMIQRKLEFIQDFGSDSHKIYSTINRLQNMLHISDCDKTNSPDIKSNKRIKLETDSSNLLNLKQNYLSDSNRCD